jgi:hypothetical protein
VEWVAADRRADRRRAADFGRREEKLQTTKAPKQ